MYASNLLTIGEPNAQYYIGMLSNENFLASFKAISRIYRRMFTKPPAIMSLEPMIHKRVRRKVITSSRLNRLTNWGTGVYFSMWNNCSSHLFTWAKLKMPFHWRGMRLRYKNLFLCNRTHEGTPDDGFEVVLFRQLIFKPFWNFI